MQSPIRNSRAWQPEDDAELQRLRKEEQDAIERYMSLADGVAEVKEEVQHLRETVKADGERRSEEAERAGVRQGKVEQLQVFLDSQGIGLHRKKKSNLRMIWDNGLKHASRYGLYNSGAGSLSLPGTFVIDSKQKIRAVFGTEDSSFESQLGAHVDKLLK